MTDTLEIAVDEITGIIEYTALAQIAALISAAGRLDVTIPGGFGYASDGTTATNCWGHPIDDYGNVTDENAFIQ